MAKSANVANLSPTPLLCVWRRVNFPSGGCSGGFLSEYNKGVFPNIKWSGIQKGDVGPLPNPIPTKVRGGYYYRFRTPRFNRYEIIDRGVAWEQ